ncbi:cupin [candidate division WS6 bacterium RIFOXYC1_FULL_33_10]|uniref:Cupin n=2 Tax=Candidatus Dojkabacteria TaxID=74243 RepID=A0A1F4UG63_9BACT|nr:MAG: cupin [candidate division WS6 bacterium RIFOXYB1_FULL_33_14]OGC46271.1 MAG: cupin [candidate division WS6 bacterium RIFOXYC1_FULL_33_10]
MGYIDNIEDRTKENRNFRKVLYTGTNMQLVVMSLKPGEDIGVEVHDSVDQFFRVEQGEGKVVMNGQESEVKEEMVFIVPAGVEHNVINTSDLEELKIYTIYAPPNHPQETVHITREDAMLAEEEHHH